MRALEPLEPDPNPGSHERSDGPGSLPGPSDDRPQRQRFFTTYQLASPLGGVCRIVSAAWADGTLLQSASRPRAAAAGTDRTSRTCARADTGRSTGARPGAARGPRACGTTGTRSCSCSRATPACATSSARTLSVRNADRSTCQQSSRQNRKHCLAHFRLPLSNADLTEAAHQRSNASWNRDTRFVRNEPERATLEIVRGRATDARLRRQSHRSHELCARSCPHRSRTSRTARERRSPCVRHRSD